MHPDKKKYNVLCTLLNYILLYNSIHQAMYYYIIASLSNLKLML